MTTRTTQTGIQVTTPGTAELRSDVPIPRIRDDYIIAETRAFALNATDNHHIKYLAGQGTIIGCDWSGVVRAVGKDVTRFRPGDAVYGVCHGGNTVETEDGAFAELIACKEHATSHKPEGLSFEEAASLGVALATVGQVLYWVMKLPLPSAGVVSGSGPSVLVYGGSSATGTIAIQAAKLSGCRVYTTCSPNNFDLVKSRGADYVLDYNLPDSSSALLELAGNSITQIIDCLGSPESSAFCSKILPAAGGHYHSVKAPIQENFKVLRPEENVTATFTIGYTMFGERFEFPGMEFPADLEEAKFAKKWMVEAEELVLGSRIRPHSVDLRGGGLRGVLEGLREMEEQGPRGRKIVYSRDEVV